MAYQKDTMLILVEKYHDGNCEDKEILAASARRASLAAIKIVKM